MSKKLAIVPLLLLLALGTSARGAEASTINLDAQINDIFNPINLFLEAGSWIVTPIVADFESWSRHIDSWCDDSGCTQGFENSYYFSAPDLGVMNAWNGIFYPFASDAVGYGVSSTFTLATAQTVSFYLDDFPLGDNRGGESLDLAAIPEPASLTLLVTGLAAFGRR